MRRQSGGRGRRQVVLVSLTVSSRTDAVAACAAAALRRLDVPTGAGGRRLIRMISVRRRSAAAVCAIIAAAAVIDDRRQPLGASWRRCRIGIHADARAPSDLNALGGACAPLRPAGPATACGLDDGHNGHTVPVSTQHFTRRRNATLRTHTHTHNRQTH